MPASPPADGKPLMPLMPTAPRPHLSSETPSAALPPDRDKSRGDPFPNFYGRERGEWGVPRPRFQLYCLRPVPAEEAESKLNTISSIAWNSVVLTYSRIHSVTENCKLVRKDPIYTGNPDIGSSPCCLQCSHDPSKCRYPEENKRYHRRLWLMARRFCI